tara:strand:- start:191 stop:1300 length:1110 start_codon:yes stop_codon:yes gene_type:complete
MSIKPDMDIQEKMSTLYKLQGWHLTISLIFYYYRYFIMVFRDWINYLSGKMPYNFRLAFRVKWNDGDPSKKDNILHITILSGKTFYITELWSTFRRVYNKSNFIIDQTLESKLLNFSNLYVMANFDKEFALRLYQLKKELVNEFNEKNLFVLPKSTNDKPKTFPYTLPDMLRDKGKVEDANYMKKSLIYTGGTSFIPNSHTTLLYPIHNNGKKSVELENLTFPLVDSNRVPLVENYVDFRTKYKVEDIILGITTPDGRIERENILFTAQKEKCSIFRGFTNDLLSYLFSGLCLFYAKMCIEKFVARTHIFFLLLSFLLTEISSLTRAKMIPNYFGSNFVFTAFYILFRIIFFPFKVLEFPMHSPAYCPN